MQPLFNFVRIFLLSSLLENIQYCSAEDILGCGGFVKSHASLDFSKIEIGLYSKEGSLKEKTECAPTNGYYFLPLYEKGEYVLKIHPPAGWSFEPSEVNIVVDGSTDQCSSGQDINFSFNGFGITGQVITAGQHQGPGGISVQLVNEKGELRTTVTNAGGNFHFTPVIPGKYNIKASHPRWKLEPSQAAVHVKEGNTALPKGVLAVKGYDVRGSITSFGSPLSGLHVLLYSQENHQKLRVEGCKTALLQGVPDSPICYSITDSNGEFTFGLVPAGNYKLLALSTAPGQVAVTYNLHPESVPFSVQHDSLYIKNAFEVRGFTLVGTVKAAVGGAPLSGVRVAVDGRAIASSDAGGKYTLPNLTPGTYRVTFQHEQCELEPIELVVPVTGGSGLPQSAAVRWRVCGGVLPAASRSLLLRHSAPPRTTRVTSDGQGKWCTFLPSGVYTASVELSEQEQRDGLQYFPLSQKISVGHAAVDGVSFSQLKGTVKGQVRCLRPEDCRGLAVSLRTLTADGIRAGTKRTADVVDGWYSFTEVTAGSVELSVGGEGVCWQRPSHTVAVASEKVSPPDFVQTGYYVKVHASHPLELEYISDKERGVVTAEMGSVCLPRAARYELRARSCHKFQPSSVMVDLSAPDANSPPTVHLRAVAHEVTVRVLAPELVDDLMLVVSSDAGTQRIGPLEGVEDKAEGGYGYRHTMYMADGEAGVVSAESSRLVGGTPQQVVGRSRCQPNALSLRATRGITLSGRTVPPAPGAVVTVAVRGEIVAQQTVGADGSYKFGPLEASRQYVVSASLDSYAFSSPDENGDIRARKLAEIAVELVDDADSKPLQGGLVSVSGGSYRRNTLSGPDGRVRFTALAPDQYYVKPHMKEYRFNPPHSILQLPDGETRNIQLRGSRMAWGCSGRVVSLGGSPWSGAVVRAVPAAGAASCSAEEAAADTQGQFRIRGLLPSCSYTLQLKESAAPELAGLRLVKAPPLIEVKDKKDVENVVVVGVRGKSVTDGSVTVTTSAPHWRSLRLTVAANASPNVPLLSSRLEPPAPSLSPVSPVMFALPRLPADHAVYTITLESTLSKSTHSYEDTTIYFTSDGAYKHFDIEFAPKVRSAEQELRQSSLVVMPLLGLVAAAWLYRDHLLIWLKEAWNARHHHLAAASALSAGKRTAKKKAT